MEDIISDYEMLTADEFLAKYPVDDYGDLEDKVNEN